MEPELECFDAQTRKAEGFGELKGGFMVRCSLAMCRRCVPSRVPLALSSDLNYDNSNSLDPAYFSWQRSLLDSTHFLLPLLGARFPLEAAVGVNGRVWVNAKDTREVIGIARCIEAVDPDGDGGGMDEAGVVEFLRTLGL
jgi:exosome complex component RRP40